jgi:hypothetical protein
MVTVPSVPGATLPGLSGEISVPSVGFSPGTYAATMVSAATAAIRELAGLADDFHQEPIEFNFDRAPRPPELNEAERPTLIDFTFSFPSPPSALNTQLIIDDILPDQFDEDAPVLTLTDAPAAFSDTAPTAPSVTTSFGDPGELSVSMPAAPALLALNVVPFAGVTTYTFDEAAPTVDLTAPSIVPYVAGDEYSSSLLTLLRSTFLTRIEDGGTGLPADVENALWDRGREREARSSRDAIAKLEQMEAMGFHAPPGVYLDARLRIITETDAALKGVSREIMIKQAELEQANILKALEQASVLEGQWLESWNKTEQRKFDTAKYSTEAQISLYNAKVSAFNGMLEAYKAKVNVFEAKIRAETQKVEAYRAQIAAEQAKAEINRALVDQYKVQSDIALSAIEIFKAKVDAIRSKAEIEKLKVEIFREQIGAFTARVNAYTAQVEGYKASTQAEVSKQDAFKSKVQSYVAQVEAASKVIDARVAELKAKVDVKQSEYDGYKSTVSAESARIAALSSYNTALTDQYKAETQASASFNDALTKQWSAQIELIKSKAEVATQVAKTNSDIVTATGNIAVEAAKASGQIAAQIGAAALSAYNISASASMSGSMNVSATNSSSVSGSATDSYSESDSRSESDVKSKSYSESDSRSDSNVSSNSFSRSFADNWSQSFANSKSYSQSDVNSDSKSQSTSTSTSENKNYNF